MPGIATRTAALALSRLQGGGTGKRLTSGSEVTNRLRKSPVAELRGLAGRGGAQGKLLRELTDVSGTRRRGLPTGAGRAVGDLARALKGSTTSSAPKWMTPKAKNKFEQNVKRQARWGNTPRRI